MKRVLKNSIVASTDAIKNNMNFTAADVLKFLMTIEELHQTPIELIETENDSIAFNIGDSTYQITHSNDSVTM